MHLSEFLKLHKIKLVIKKGIENPKLYSCEMLNGFIKKGYYYINTYGYGNNEEEAINSFIELISDQTIIMNIDNPNKKTIIRVPTLEQIYDSMTIVAMINKYDKSFRHFKLT